MGIARAGHPVVGSGDGAVLGEERRGFPQPEACCSFGPAPLGRSSDRRAVTAFGAAGEIAHVARPQLGGWVQAGRWWIGEVDLRLGPTRQRSG